jgi:16S rRNA (cytosine1402-N4)-methyltransferase
MSGCGKEKEGSMAAGGYARHTPVLLTQVVAALSPRDGGRYVDATFGAGGYSCAILESAKCSVLGIDRDPTAISAGEEIAKRLAQDDRLQDDRLRGGGAGLTVVLGRFRDLERIGRERGFAPADGVVFDLGVSSMQLDQPERGFSFMQDGPLDMRMSGEGPSAADVVNSLDEKDLADIFFMLGQERRSRAVAKEIVRRRAIEPFARTLDLARLVARVVGRGREETKHPATRCFQALRIYVNDELNEIAEGLCAAERLLRPGGRLVVVSFHSLEDRIVKRFFAERCGRRARPSRHAPDWDEAAPWASFAPGVRHPVEPSAEETRANPRSRSARLRWGERTDAPPVRLDLQALGLPALNIPATEGR